LKIANDAYEYQFQGRNNANGHISYDDILEFQGQDVAWVGMVAVEMER
jgi:hypothetical protein